MFFIFTAWIKYGQKIILSTVNDFLFVVNPNEKDVFNKLTYTTIITV